MIEDADNSLDEVQLFDRLVARQHLKSAKDLDDGHLELGIGELDANTVSRALTKRHKGHRVSFCGESKEWNFISSKKRSMVAWLRHLYLKG